jgi:hypothetical protein
MNTQTTPQVMAIKASGDCVIVTYSDGIMAVFEMYAHGIGYSIEGLRHFALQHNGQEPFFIYDGRLYRCGPCDDENVIRRQPENYDQRIAASYWVAADNWLQANYYKKLSHNSSRDKPLDDLYWFPWRLICCEGCMDRDRMAEGKIPVRIR